MKNIKQANININIKDLFFSWLNIISSFHNLPPQEEKILALLLYHHYKLQKEVTNEKILWKLVFDYDTKKLIKNELGIADQSMQNALTKLRKQNIIIDNKITKAFIPTLEQGANNFKIIFNFNIIHE